MGEQGESGGYDVRDIFLKPDPEKSGKLSEIWRAGNQLEIVMNTADIVYGSCFVPGTDVRWDEREFCSSFSDCDISVIKIRGIDLVIFVPSELFYIGVGLDVAKSLENVVGRDNLRREMDKFFASQFNVSSEARIRKCCEEVIYEISYDNSIGLIELGKEENAEGRIRIPAEPERFVQARTDSPYTKFKYNLECISKGFLCRYLEALDSGNQ